MNELSKFGECEVCDSKDIQITAHYGNLWMCDECWTKEQKLTIANNTPEKQQERVNLSNIAIEASRLINSSISVRTDIFNAQTISIIELKNSIDADESITNKPYVLAETLQNQFKHFKSVIFELNEQIIEANNKQKAIQVYLNDLANKLRAEERERLKISDINYQPIAVKSAKPKTIKTSSSKKLDKKEIAKYAKELNIGAYNLQAICISKGISPEMAANMIRRSINEAKSESIK